MNTLNKKIEQLIELYNSKSFSVLIEECKNYIKNDDTKGTVWNLLALGYKNSGDLKRAQSIYENLLKHNCTNILFLNNLGNIYSSLGRQTNAISLFKRSLILTAGQNSIDAMEALGLAYGDIGDSFKAIKYFEWALKLNVQQPSIRFHLADNYRKLKLYNEAITHFDLTDFGNSKTLQLECVYISKDKDMFLKKQSELIQKNISNSLIGCLSSHASVRYAVPENNPFCGEPLSFVFHKNLISNLSLTSELIGNIARVAKDKLVDSRKQNLLKGGLQSAGNAFLLDNSHIKDLKVLIENQINEYRSHFSTSSDNFIKRWPKNYELYGWFVTMESGGSLDAHMHREGWLSGSLYIDIPESKNKEEGNIVFSLNGADYPTNENRFPEMVADISTGDICMFPSSLFHYTVPFFSLGKRITFAFDIIPK